LAWLRECLVKQGMEAERAENTLARSKAESEDPAHYAKMLSAFLESQHGSRICGDAKGRRGHHRFCHLLLLDVLMSQLLFALDSDKTTSAKGRRAALKGSAGKAFSDRLGRLLPALAAAIRSEILTAEQAAGEEHARREDLDEVSEIGEVLLQSNLFPLQFLSFAGGKSGLPHLDALSANAATVLSPSAAKRLEKWSSCAQDDVQPRATSNFAPAVAKFHWCSPIEERLKTCLVRALELVRLTTAIRKLWLITSSSSGATFQRGRRRLPLTALSALVDV